MDRELGRGYGRATGSVMFSTVSPLSTTMLYDLCKDIPGACSIWSCGQPLNHIAYKLTAHAAIGCAFQTPEFAQYFDSHRPRYPAANTC